LMPLSTLGAAGAGAGAGQQVLDSVRSVLEAVACLGPPALPTGPLVAGLSSRLLRLVSTLDALPSLVTLCTVEGQEAVACLGPPALPTGPLVAGLSGRLLRLVSTLDALPSLVTLCTVEGQILYQNSSSLFYTGSPAARAAAAESRHRPGS
ncbi:hypothetical protein HaLaN_12688, partial [Haematococcus lacustris]